ncbi:Oligopeptide transport system permease protein OppB [Salinispira pacifica]|uniref:Oligopeptide transport system permease protein OppB n=2 Tax=Salinispira pacifica TaxID=1307761 RepID=V5WKV3_9SPIO|nr:Oligopeptide transport system permease protein OppB [Salinispira pacifica]
MVFPSTSKQAASTALLIELARAAAEAPAPPKRDIVFALWNSSEIDGAGAEFFTRNPELDLGQSDIIHIQNAGMGGIQTSVVSDGRHGGIISSLITQYGANRGLPAVKASPDSRGSIIPFMNLRIPAIVLEASSPAPDGILNTSHTVDLQALALRGKVLGDYLDCELFTPPPFLSILPRSMLLAAALLFNLILLVRILEQLSRIPGSRDIWERIYFHPASGFIRKSASYLLPAALAMFLFILIIQLPPDSQVNRSTGQDSISTHLLLKNSWNFVRDFFRGNLRTSADSGTIISILLTSGLQSLKLIGGALGVSALAAFLTARRSVQGPHAFSQGRRSISPGGILGASVPGIVVILAMLSLYVAVSEIWPQLSRNLQLQQSLFPLISISILPAAYSARMTGLRIDREMQRSYILAARARGYSPRRIFRTQLLRPLAGSFGENLPSLMALILTNLILVEYLFNYKGLVFYLLYFYQRHDASSFISVSLALLLLYSLVSLAGGAMAMIFQPMKTRRLV